MGFSFVLPIVTVTFRLNNHPYTLLYRKAKQSIISSINPSKINNKQQLSPSKIENPSRITTNTQLDSQKNINNKIQVSPDPELSAATKRTLADRSPPFLPIDIDRHPTGKPKHNMDIANITNPATTTTLTSDPDFHFGPTTAPTASALSLNGPLDFGVLPGMPDWFQPIMAMITSQGQRLAHLEALTKENQSLRADLEAAHRRIKELETLNTTLPAAPTTAAINKPAGSEASKWKSPPTPTSTPAPTTSSFASAARKGMRTTQPSKPKPTTRTRKVPTKRQLQVVARIFAPPSENNGYQYLYLPCRFRESITSVRKKVGMLGLENWRILDVYHPTTRVVALLVHNDYASTATSKLGTAGIKLINDFDPRDPSNLRDIKYQDLSENEKQQKMVQIHTSHLLTALDRMRPTVRPAVARDFIAKQWITTQQYATHIKPPAHTHSQDIPVDTDMDEITQPVPAGNGEPDTEQ